MSKQNLEYISSAFLKSFLRIYFVCVCLSYSFIQDVGGEEFPQIAFSLFAILFSLSWTGCHSRLLIPKLGEKIWIHTFLMVLEGVRRECKRLAQNLNSVNVSIFCTNVICLQWIDFKLILLTKQCQFSLYGHCSLISQSIFD